MIASNVSLLSEAELRYELRRRIKRPRSAIKSTAPELPRPTMGGGAAVSERPQPHSHRQLADWCSGYHVSFTSSEYSPTRSPVRSRGWSLEALPEIFTFALFETSFLLFPQAHRSEDVLLFSMSWRLSIVTLAAISTPYNSGQQ